jgi:hypothetical protein
MTFGEQNMHFAFRNVARVAFPPLALIALTACGGGRSPAPPLGGTASGGTVIWPNTTHTVGGTVSGLVDQGVTIELLNPATSAHHTIVLEQIDIVANGAFVFRIPPSKSYGVAIVHQPHSPTQRCVVRNGQGVIGTANVTDVGIVCGVLADVTRSITNTIPAFTAGKSAAFIATV